MPKEVEFNGKVIEFPDDMPNSEIEAVLAREIGEPAASRPPGFAESVIGAGETALQLGTGAVAAPIAGLHGILAGLVPGGKTAAEAVESTTNRFTFLPRSETGQAVSEKVGAGLGRVDQAVTDFAQNLGDDDDVLGATLAKTAILGLPSILGFRGIKTQPRPLNNKAQVAKAAQEEGYVLPTSDVSPSPVRGTVESAAGLPRMRQQASVRNQSVTNNLAARELGLPDGTEITLDLLDGIRSQAGQAYGVLRGSGQIIPDVTFRRNVANAVKDLKSATKDFSSLKKDLVGDVLDIADEFQNARSFDANSVPDVTKLLRDKAKTAFRAGDTSAGRAYRGLSDAIESAAENHLVRQGNQAAVQQFRDARQQIAKTYTIEQALDGDGFVSAPKLAAMRKKRQPLGENLTLAAKFAEQFPNSARVFKRDPIAVGRLSTILGAGGVGAGAGAANPLLALLSGGAAFAGPAIRAGMLSRPAQALFNRPGVTTTGLPQAGAGLLTSGALAE